MIILIKFAFVSKNFGHVHQYEFLLFFFYARYDSAEKFTNKVNQIAGFG